MANLRLKKMVLEVVNNQIKANDPPCTKDSYEKLLDAGYSRSEAKDKIGAVALTEIYDILKVGKSFDEAKYQKSLEEMVQQCIDFEDDQHVETEWDEWDKLVQDGYEYFDEQKSEEGLNVWGKAWLIFQSILQHQSKKIPLIVLIEELDYVYAIDGWLQDYEMELGNARKYEERITFCQKVLEMFDWQDDDDSCFLCGIGESLFYEGKKRKPIATMKNGLQLIHKTVMESIAFVGSFLKMKMQKKHMKWLEEQPGESLVMQIIPFYSCVQNN